MTVARSDAKASDLLGRFREVVEGRHAYAKDWKAKGTGRKVFGRFCTYVPEEILYSAGILPIRIMGSHEPFDIADPYISSWFCGFCRDCLAQGLSGRYDYLDGVVKARSCSQLRGAYAAWVASTPNLYHHYISMPSALGLNSNGLPDTEDHQLLFLKTELIRFKESLEKWMGHSVTEDSLDRAIDAYNVNRRLLRQLYDFRKADEPKISGAEALEVALASKLMDKVEHSELLTDLLATLSSREDFGKPGIRVMMMGAEVDDFELLRLIESMGCTIVIDEDCNGSRSFWDDIDPLPDRLLAIAIRYMKRIPCPQKDYPTSRRLPHIFRLIEDFRAQGVILIQQKFCDPWEHEAADVVPALAKRGIPSLVVEYDPSVRNWGPLRTRVEAFSEMLDTAFM